LAVNVAAVAFDAASGRLNLRPDSSAYGVQARLSAAHLVAAANKAVGREVVRTIRVLPPSPATPALAVGTAAALSRPDGGPRSICWHDDAGARLRWLINRRRAFQGRNPLYVRLSQVAVMDGSFGAA
jgi:hypothetical protein